MKPEIVMWNVRGLNELNKRLRIKGLLRDWKADIVCLLETKMAIISRRWFRVYGVASMWIGAIWEQVECRVGFC